MCIVAFLCVFGFIRFSRWKFPTASQILEKITQPALQIIIESTHPQVIMRTCFRYTFYCYVFCLRTYTYITDKVEEEDLALSCNSLALKNTQGKPQ